jgi:hypothetical protein
MRTKKMELWNIGIMVLNQKKHFDATQYSNLPSFLHSLNGWPFAYGQNIIACFF